MRRLIFWRRVVGRRYPRGRLLVPPGYRRPRYASRSGAVLSLIAVDPEDRDPGLSETTREAIMEAITADAPEGEADGRDRVANRAVALRAVLSGAETGLTSGERALLSEWPDRLGYGGWHRY